MGKKFIFFKYIYLYVGCTGSQVAACKTFSCGRRDLAPWLGIEPYLLHWGGNGGGRHREWGREGRREGSTEEGKKWGRERGHLETAPMSHALTPWALCVKWVFCETSLHIPTRRVLTDSLDCSLRADPFFWWGKWSQRLNLHVFIFLRLHSQGVWNDLPDSSHSWLRLIFEVQGSLPLPASLHVHVNADPVPPPPH